MSLTLKAAAVLFAALSTSGDVVVSSDASSCTPKCAGGTRAVVAAKPVAGTQECDPQCEPPECAAKCPEAAQASCEKPQAQPTSQAALTCARR
jgi:hypothetical protein